RALAQADLPRVRLALDRRRRGRARARLVPEHDLAALDLDDRGRVLAGPVAAAVRAVAEEERRGRRRAPAVDREDPARARKRGVPGDRVVLRVQGQDGVALDHFGVPGEELAGGVVVALVERLAPGTDDALGVRRAGAAAREREKRQQRQCPPQASTSRTSPW